MAAASGPRGLRITPEPEEPKSAVERPSCVGRSRSNSTSRWGRPLPAGRVQTQLGPQSERVKVNSVLARPVVMEVCQYAVDFRITPQGEPEGAMERFGECRFIGPSTALTQVHPASAHHREESFVEISGDSVSAAARVRHRRSECRRSRAGDAERNPIRKAASPPSSSSTRMEVFAKCWKNSRGSKRLGAASAGIPHHTGMASTTRMWSDSSGRR